MISRRLIYYIYILGTFMFIGKMTIEFLNCFQLWHVLNSASPIMNESSYQYFIQENRQLIDKVVNLTHWGIIYAILSLVYFIVRGKPSLPTNSKE